MQTFFSYNNFFYIIKSNDFKHLADYSKATSKEFCANGSDRIPYEPVAPNFFKCNHKTVLP